MYSYNEYTMLRLRLGRWAQEHPPAPAQPMRGAQTNLWRRLTALLKRRSVRVKATVSSTAP